MNPSLGKISEFGEHDSEIVLSQRVTGFDANGKLEVCLRARQIALLIKDDAQVIVNFSVFGVDPQGVLKMAPGAR